MGSSRANDRPTRINWRIRKSAQIGTGNAYAYGSMKSRIRKMALCPQERKLGVLAGGFESSRSFPASQPPHPKSFPRPKTVSKSRPVWWCFRIRHSSDARISCLFRFLMNRPPSEDGFLFTGSRFELLQSGVIALCFPFGPHYAPWFPFVLRLCSAWRRSWEY